MKRTAKFRKHPVLQEPSTQHFFLDDNDSVPEIGGSRPDRLADVRPQERVARRIVEQIVDSAPVLPLLHAPVPQTVDSVEEVLKILDKLVPDVEQVIEVPKSLQHTVPQRSSLQEPQMAEQLVAVPAIEFIVFRHLEGEYLLATRVSCVCATPDEETPLAQGGIQILGTGDVSATMHDKFQQPSPDSRWCLSSVHRQSGGSCRYATETGTHSVKLCILDWLLTCPLLCNARCAVHARHGRRHPFGA